MEIWKTIEDFPDYEISNHGRVKSHKWKKIKILSPIKNNNGYLWQNLCSSGKQSNRQIHRLVLDAFVGKRQESMDASHLDGNRENNNLDNLVWESRTDNNRRKESTKLNKLKVSWMRLLLERGWRPPKLSKEFGVSRQVINHVKYNKTWKAI